MDLNPPIEAAAVKNRFSRQAKMYAMLNTPQRQVAKNLIAEIAHLKPRRILDVGAGCGAVYEQIHWPLECFVAVDFASMMCQLHPKGEGVWVVQADFNNPNELDSLARYGPYDLVISSSALQWAVSLEDSLSALSRLSARAALALFTAGTFDGLNRYLGKASPLPTATEAMEIIGRHFDAEIRVEKFCVGFESVRSLFDFIRQSGVGGGSPGLSVAQARSLLLNYPGLDLEFEVVYALAKG
ncbi:MAG: methyltransferase [Campylobacterales bacterium]